MISIEVKIFVTVLEISHIFLLLSPKAQETDRGTFYPLPKNKSFQNKFTLIQKRMENLALLQRC